MLTLCHFVNQVKVELKGVCDFNWLIGSWAPASSIIDSCSWCLLVSVFVLIHEHCCFCIC